MRDEGFVDSGGVKIHYVAERGAPEIPPPAPPSQGGENSPLASASQGEEKRPLAFPSQGGDKKPLVVLIHGFPDFCYSWRSQTPALAQIGDVVAIDQRGFNLSDQPEGVESYHVGKLVGDVHAVVAHFQRDKAILVGHDWGGLVAWLFAMSYPQHTDRLVILNLPHPKGLARELANNPAQRASSQYARILQQPGSESLLTPELLASWVKEPEDRAIYEEALRRSSMEGMVNYYRANYPREPYRDEQTYPPVRCPVLMIHGLKDPYLLAGALNDTWQWLDNEFTLVTLPNAGHFVHRDESELVMRTMCDWLTKTTINSRSTAQFPSPLYSGERGRGEGAFFKERTMYRMIPCLILALGGLAVADHPAEKEAVPAVLMEGLGTLHHPVSTKNAEAQKFFDQGLRLIYAFNHDEALRSFKKAAELDPGLAMAYWGMALAVGPNYNVDAMEAQLKDAHTAISKAMALGKAAPRHEQDYIAALAKRYAADPKTADKKKLAQAYKEAMGDLAKRYPDDLDAATLYAESAMNLRPWDLWTLDGKPADGTVEILATLEGVLRRNPKHMGACHYYIHAIEASPYPERALGPAERLGELAPAAGHLVHMPSHIYIRLGDFAAAVCAPTTRPRLRTAPTLRNPRPRASIR